MSRLASVVTRPSKPSRKATTKNLQSYPAFDKSLEQRYLQMVLTNTFGRTYYVKQRKMIEEAVKLHADMAAADPEFMARALVYARRHGYMRSQPVYGLAVLSKASPRWFRWAFPLVINTPKDLLDFFVVARTMRGWGRTLKTAASQWLDDRMSSYWAVKYGSLTSGSFSLRNVYRVVHAKHKDPEKNAIARYVVRGASGCEEVTLPDQIQAFEALKRATTVKEKMALIERGRLPHEVATSFAGSSKQIWRKIGVQMPIFALLRNLATLERHGVIEDLREHIEGVFRNPERVRKSKILPFRFLSALGKVQTSWAAEALREGLELSFENLPDLQGKTVVMLDISSSMRGEFLQTASIFAIALMKKARLNGKLLIFNTGAKEIPVSQRDSIMTQASRIRANGGTDTGAPIRYILGSKAKGCRLKTHNYWGRGPSYKDRKPYKADTIILITDEQQNTSSPVCDALAAYQAKVNPDVKTIVVDVSPYSMSGQSLPKDPLGEKKKVWYVYGWSPTVVDFIAAVTKGWGSFVDNVRKSIAAEPNPAPTTPQR